MFVGLMRAKELRSTASHSCLPSARWLPLPRAFQYPCLGVLLLPQNLPFKVALVFHPPPYTRRWAQRMPDAGAMRRQRGPLSTRAMV